MFYIIISARAQSKHDSVSTKHSGRPHSVKRFLPKNVHDILFSRLPMSFAVASSFSASLPSSNVNVNLIESKRCILRRNLHVQIVLLAGLGHVQPLPTALLIHTTIQSCVICVPFVLPCGRCGCRCGRRQRCQIGIMNLTPIIVAHQHLLAIGVVVVLQLGRRKCFHI